MVDPSAVLPGSPWTAWVAARPALLVQEGTFGPVPIGWNVLETKGPRWNAPSGAWAGSSSRATRTSATSARGSWRDRSSS